METLVGENGLIRPHLMLSNMLAIVLGLYVYQMMNKRGGMRR